MARRLPTIKCDGVSGSSLSLEDTNIIGQELRIDSTSVTAVNCSSYVNFNLPIILHKPSFSQPYHSLKDATPPGYFLNIELPTHTRFLHIHCNRRISNNLVNGFCSRGESRSIVRNH